MSRRPCNPDNNEHADAMHLVAWLFERGGSSYLTQRDIAYELGFVKRTGKTLEVMEGRYYRAVNHVKDCHDNANRPCTGYRLHYRDIKGKKHLCLVDPSGDLGSHALAAVESLRGWMVRERQHHTENSRQVATTEALADHALAQGDKQGYRLCQRAIIDLQENGTIRPTTMAELFEWADSIA